MAEVMEGVEVEAVISQSSRGGGDGIAGDGNNESDDTSKEQDCTLVSAGNSVKCRRTAKDSSASMVFEFADESCKVPKDVVRVKFHPSVVQVPPQTFRLCTR